MSPRVVSSYLSYAGWNARNFLPGDSVNVTISFRIYYFQ